MDVHDDDKIAPRAGGDRRRAYRRPLYRVLLPARNGGEPPAFRVTHRRLDFGPAAGALDLVGFPPLALGEPAGAANARAAVELFWRDRYGGGGGGECGTGGPDGPDDRRPPSYGRGDCETRLLAELALAAGRRKSLGGVYAHACLGPFARRDVALDGRELGRLRALVARRDPALVRAELDALLLGRGQLPADAAERAAFQGQYDEWVGRGLDLWRRGAEGGLYAWLGYVTGETDRIRRRGDRKQRGGRGGWARRLLNCFAYECHAALLHCCAAALDRLTGLFAAADAFCPNSLRLMRLLHAVDRSDVGTGGGGGLLLGHPASMHPVGLWLLARPAHRAALGAWVAHPDHDRLLGTAAALACPAFQGAVVALLAAAREYRVAQATEDAAAADERVQRLRRGGRPRPRPRAA